MHAEFKPSNDPEIKALVESKFAWPGGYRINFLTGGEMLCADCVVDIDADAPEQVMPYVYWEGPAEVCAGCGLDLPSEYGDPEE